MGMDQYLLIPCLVGWTSIYQLFWGSLGTRVLTHPHISTLTIRWLKHDMFTSGKIFWLSKLAAFGVRWGSHDWKWIPWRIHGAGNANMTGVYWWDGIHGTPYIPAPWIRHGTGNEWFFHWFFHWHHWFAVGTGKDLPRYPQILVCRFGLGYAGVIEFVIDGESDCEPCSQLTSIQ